MARTTRTTRNSSSGGFESLPYPGKKKDTRTTQSLPAAARGPGNSTTAGAAPSASTRASRANNANANFSIPVKRRMTEGGEPGPKPKKQQRHSVAGSRAPAAAVSSPRQTRGMRGKATVIVEGGSDDQGQGAGASVVIGAESEIRVTATARRTTRSQAKGKAVGSGTNAGGVSDDEGFMDNIISDLVAQSKLSVDVGDSLEPDARRAGDYSEEGEEDIQSVDLVSQNSADLAGDDYSTDNGHDKQGEHEVREDTQQNGVTPFHEFKTKVDQSLEGLATLKGHLDALHDSAKDLTALQSASGEQSGYLQILPVLVAALGKPIASGLTQHELVLLEEFEDKVKQMRTMAAETRALQSVLRGLLNVFAAETKAIYQGVASIEKMFKERGYEMDAATTPPKTSGASKRMEVLRAREEAVYKFNTPNDATPKSRRSRRIGARTGVENGNHSDSMEENRYQGQDEDLSDHPPVLGGDADVEVVRVESFGHRPEKTAPRAPKRHRRGEDNPVPVHEDRPWAAEELKGVFSKISQVKRGAPGKHFTLGGPKGTTRTKEEILAKAKEIKEDFVERGEQGVLNSHWDDI